MKAEEIIYRLFDYMMGKRFLTVAHTYQKDGVLRSAAEKLNIPNVNIFSFCDIVLIKEDRFDKALASIRVSEVAGIKQDKGLLFLYMKDGGCWVFNAAGGNI